MKHIRYKNEKDQLLIDILNGEDPTTGKYETSVENWPFNSPIWYELKDVFAKKNFTKYLMSKDRDLDKNYGELGWKCTSFAMQAYIKYNLHTWDLIEPKIAEKRNLNSRRANYHLRIPLFYAVSRWPNKGHAFNAVSLGNFLCKDFNKYFFIEPQTKKEIKRGLENWPKESEIKILTFFGIHEKQYSFTEIAASYEIPKVGNAGREFW